jgi:hypothetical protein
MQLGAFFLQSKIPDMKGQEMDISIWLWLAVATTIFWMVGLYNRLKKLRARALDVLTALERQVQASLTLLDTFGRSAYQPASNAPESTQDGSEEWLAVARAAQVVEAIWYSHRKNNFSVNAQQRRSESWNVLQAAWASWINVPPDLAGALVPEGMHTEWNAVQNKIRAIREALNAIVESYNEAISERPARWVVGWMGFESSTKI